MKWEPDTISHIPDVILFLWLEHLSTSFQLYPTNCSCVCAHRVLSLCGQWLRRADVSRYSSSVASVEWAILQHQNTHVQHALECIWFYYYWKMKWIFFEKCKCKTSPWSIYESLLCSLVHSLHIWFGMLSWWIALWLFGFEFMTSKFTKRIRMECYCRRHAKGGSI